jgi:hypothetical protein
MGLLLAAGQTGPVAWQLGGSVIVATDTPVTGHDSLRSDQSGGGCIDGEKVCQYGGGQFGCEANQSGVSACPGFDPVSFESISVAVAGRDRWAADRDRVRLIRGEGDREPTDLCAVTTRLTAWALRDFSRSQGPGSHVEGRSFRLFARRSQLPLRRTVVGRSRSPGAPGLTSRRSWRGGFGRPRPRWPRANTLGSPCRAAFGPAR